MPQTSKICFDRVLPQDLRRLQRLASLPGGRSRAISPMGKQWINGSTIRIRFMEGTQAQQDMVRDIAPLWTEHANLNFEFGDDPTAQIRVTFDADDGSWSYVGTDNLNLPLHAATLNLGWQDRGVILHEFGHMVGLSHEHQNPDGGILWNEEAVIRDLKGRPNYWDEATIRHNVLNKYAADQVMGTNFDPQSIMLYEFPDSWTQNMGATHENDELSSLDEMFVQSDRMDPGRPAPEDRATDIPVAAALAAEISQAGEEDLYRFGVSTAAQHVIETSGSTDVVMSLFGPDSTTNLLAQDDAGGSGTNARISAFLEPGSYYARVRHYNPQSSGEYRIRVSAY